MKPMREIFYRRHFCNGVQGALLRAGMNRSSWDKVAIADAEALPFDDEQYDVM